MAMCLGEWCMKVPADVLLQPWPQADSAPLLETVFRVLKNVANGTTSEPQASSGGGYRKADAAEPTDAPVDNVAEHVYASSPLHSPPASPMKNWTSASSNVRSGVASAENDANLKAVRLAARMVSKIEKIRVIA